jgi:hypothetical protein
MSPVKSEPDRKKAPEETEKDQPFGSVLGVIDSDPTKKLPRVAKDKGGHPSGIEVDVDRGTGDLPATAGFSSDFGAGGQDHDAVDEITKDKPRQDE